VDLLGDHDFFQNHSKGLYNDPNDCMNHSKWLFGSCETCLPAICGIRVTFLRKVLIEQLDYSQKYFTHKDFISGVYYRWLWVGSSDFWKCFESNMWGVWGRNPRKNFAILAEFPLIFHHKNRYCVWVKFFVKIFLNKNITSKKRGSSDLWKKRGGVMLGWKRR